MADINKDKTDAPNLDSLKLWNQFFDLGKEMERDNALLERFKTNPGAVLKERNLDAEVQDENGASRRLSELASQNTPEELEKAAKLMANPTMERAQELGVSDEAFGIVGGFLAVFVAVAVNVVAVAQFMMVAHVGGVANALDVETAIGAHKYIAMEVEVTMSDGSGDPEPGNGPEPEGGNDPEPGDNPEPEGGDDPGENPEPDGGDDPEGNPEPEEGGFSGNSDGGGYSGTSGGGSPEPNDGNDDSGGFSGWNGGGGYTGNNGGNSGNGGTSGGGSSGGGSSGGNSGNGGNDDGGGGYTGTAGGGGYSGTSGGGTSGGGTSGGDTSGGDTSGGDDGAGGFSGWNGSGGFSGGGTSGGDESGREIQGESGGRGDSNGFGSLIKGSGSEDGTLIDGTVRGTGVEDLITGAVRGTGVEDLITGAVRGTGVEDLITGAVRGTGVEDLITGAVRGTGVEDLITGAVRGTGVEDLITGAVRGTGVDDLITGAVRGTGVDDVITGAVRGTGVEDLITGAVRGTGVADLVVGAVKGAGEELGGRTEKEIGEAPKFVEPREPDSPRPADVETPREPLPIKDNTVSEPTKEVSEPEKPAAPKGKGCLTSILTATAAVIIYVVAAISAINKTETVVIPPQEVVSVEVGSTVEYPAQTEDGQDITYATDGGTVDGNQITFTETGEITVTAEINLPGWAAPVATVTGNPSTQESTMEVHEHVHAYESEVVREATCTEEGLVKYTCECGESYEEMIPALGHEWGEAEVTEPTCEEDGHSIVRCERCGEEEDTILPAQGHDWVSETYYVQEPTGSIYRVSYRRCSRCGAKG